ncbi:hypothetical protein OHAE_2642 [Ochrobactrum soli]|uniref:Uncharacterized protein n=1 Tax=Ochrobactrum soli TaxID=2448455 RepID=A0A2P9HRP7_9HYPH|nr:hypothetical protein OHAE_2642 [[Ochrobactrum] soli]
MFSNRAVWNLPDISNATRGAVPEPGLRHNPKRGPRPTETRSD